MKLLLATREYPPELSALSTWSLEISRRLATRCDDFAMLRIGTGAASLAEAGSWLDVIHLPAQARSLASIAARRLGGNHASRFDVVLGVDWLSAALGLMLRGRSRIRRVFSMVHGRELEGHGRRASWPLGAMYQRTSELTLGRFDAVFATSGQVRAQIDERGWYVRRHELVGPGCDVERFRPAAADALRRELGLSGRRVLLSVARLVPERRIDKVLFAVSALGVRYPDLRYVIAGDGPERERLELLAERLRIAHRIRFLGAVEEAQLPSVYNLCDVVVHLSAGLPPFTDASGSVLLEALASGKPVVASCSAATEEALDEQTGVIVPDDDSTALGEALAFLLDHPEHAERLGQLGRQRVQATATWDLAADRLLRAIEAADEPVSLGIEELAAQVPTRARRMGAAAGVVLAGR